MDSEIRIISSPINYLALFINVIAFIMNDYMYFYMYHS